ncbi:MAG: hypothetical protein F6K41_35390 [Symploca sp. SIO3E6]|nr:hypothetical protein [Caldora sp. SIO3E6]
MAKRANLYLAQAGQAVVMAEFLARGWNVAVPQVDVGDDLFIVCDSNGQFTRTQVKTASAQQRSYGYSAQFRLPLKQLQTVSTPELTYVFVVRNQQTWSSFTLMPRQELNRLYQIYGIGTVAENYLLLTFQYEQSLLRCSAQDLSKYLNNWTQFPIIDS